MNVSYLFTQPAPGLTATHNLLKHDAPSSDRLMVVLPGRGYTYDMPLLYFLRLGAYDLGYDVLSVQYGFQADLQNPMAGGDLISEVNAALALVDLSSYQDVVIAGKSMGTPLAVELSKQIKVARLILLTPIQNVVAKTGDTPTLAVIGTADQAYNAATVSNDADRANVRWEVFDNLDHGLLKPGDIPSSLAILPEIIASCLRFLG